MNGKFIASDLCFILRQRLGKAADLRFTMPTSVICEEIPALAKGASNEQVNKSDFGSHVIAYVPIETHFLHSWVTDPTGAAGRKLLVESD